MPEPHEAVRPAPRSNVLTKTSAGSSWSSTDRLAPAGNTSGRAATRSPIAIRSDSTYLSTWATRWGLPVVTAVNSSAGSSSGSLAPVSGFRPATTGTGGVKSTAGCSRPIWRTPSPVVAARRTVYSAWPLRITAASAPRRSSTTRPRQRMPFPQNSADEPSGLKNQACGTSGRAS